MVLSVSQRSNSKDNDPISETTITISQIATTSTATNVESNKTDEIVSNELLKRLDPDKLIGAYGTYGSYQMFTYIMVQMVNFLYAAHMYVMSYVQLGLEKHCEYGNAKNISITDQCVIEEQNLTIGMPFLQDQTCGVYRGSKVIHPGHSKFTNLLIDYGYDCSHWIIQELGLSLFTVGAVVTVPITSYFADRYGRRPIVIGAMLTALCANLCATISPNYSIFLVCRTILGAASDTYLSIANVMTCEFMTERSRAWITVVYNFAWVAGMCWVIVASLITESWRWRYFIVAAPGLYTFFMWCYLPETPHWLLANGKTEQVRKYIKISNKFNNKCPAFENCETSGKEEVTHNDNLTKVWKSPRYLWTIVANGHIDFTISLIYFAASFLSVELGDDNITAFFYSAMVEVPSGLVVVPLMLFFGRKTIVIVALMIQSITLMLAGIFMDSYTAHLVFILTAKSMANIVYSVHPIWALEQFPTSMRSISMSVMNVPQSMGILMSPYAKHIRMTPKSLPYTIVAGASLMATGMAFSLKETKNRKLPTNLSKMSNTSEIVKTEPSEK